MVWPRRPFVSCRLTAEEALRGLRGLSLTAEDGLRGGNVQFTQRLYCMNCSQVRPLPVLRPSDEPPQYYWKLSKPEQCPQRRAPEVQ